MIREACPYKGLNRSLGRSCTDDSMCTQCVIDIDVSGHNAMYEALEDK